MARSEALKRAQAKYQKKYRATKAGMEKNREYARRNRAKLKAAKEEEKKK